MILKPCPFCGGIEILVKKRKTTMVECKECGVVVFDCHRKGPSGATARRGQHDDHGRENLHLPDGGPMLIGILAMAGCVYGAREGGAEGALICSVLGGAAGLVITVLYVTAGPQ